MTLKEFYEQLLIIQYYNKPKARAEIGLEATRWQAIKDFIERLKESFVLDNATDDRLDKIGKIVGVNRIVPFVVEKEFFGFSININASGFASKADPSRIGAPFVDRFAPRYTATQLDDANYLFLIKAKIAFNQVHAVMAGDVVTLQDVIGFLFEGGFVVDNKDMTLNLVIPFDVDLEKLRLVSNAGLIPSPQGVGYSIIYQASLGESFGFSNNENSLGFGHKSDSSYNGGKFARKVTL